MSSFFKHESAYVDEGAQIGENSQIWHFSHIMGRAAVGRNCKIGQNVFVANGVVIGDHVKIQNNVSIYEGVVLEDYVFCGPSIVFTNVTNPRCEFPRDTTADYRPTLIKRGASLGANATIVCGVTINEGGFVAAGAVVTRDVKAYSLVAGVPAKHIGWMSAYGERLEFGEEGLALDSCGHSYELSEGSVRRVT